MKFRLLVWAGIGAFCVACNVALAAGILALMALISG